VEWSGYPNKRNYSWVLENEFHYPRTILDAYIRKNIPQYEAKRHKKHSPHGGQDNSAILVEDSQHREQKDDSAILVEDSQHREQQDDSAILVEDIQDQEQQDDSAILVENSEYREQDGSAVPIEDRHHLIQQQQQLFNAVLHLV
jgi:hypothetical protein